MDLGQRWYGCVLVVDLQIKLCEARFEEVGAMIIVLGQCLYQLVVVLDIGLLFQVDSSKSRTSQPCDSRYVTVWAKILRTLDEGQSE